MVNSVVMKENLINDSKSQVIDVRACNKPITKVGLFYCHHCLKSKRVHCIQTLTRDSLVDAFYLNACKFLFYFDADSFFVA